MSKYTWEETEQCKECHYRDKEDPDICHFNEPPEVKPTAFNFYTDCNRYLRESKWQRLVK